MRRPKTGADAADSRFRGRSQLPISDEARFKEGPTRDSRKCRTSAQPPFQPAAVRFVGRRLDRRRRYFRSVDRS